jgi:hypothetical protein
VVPKIPNSKSQIPKKQTKISNLKTLTKEAGTAANPSRILSANGVPANLLAILAVLAQK